jgi:hypothetical protein
LFTFSHAEWHTYSGAEHYSKAYQVLSDPVRVLGCKSVTYAHSMRRTCELCMIKMARAWYGASFIQFSVCSSASTQVDKEGNVNIEDAASFFANVFGGERFEDWASHHPSTCPTIYLTCTTMADRRDIYHEGHDLCSHDHDDRRRKS